MPTATRKRCGICNRLFSTDTLSQCSLTCRKLTCRKCSCPCDRPTSDKAFEAGIKALGHLIPQARQTVCVEDEFGVPFSVTGPTEWMMRVPKFDDLEAYLPTELAKVHEVKRQQAVSTGQAGYLTPAFGVAIKRFDIEGRVFTSSVFDPA